jgi:molybdate transport system permease protein
MMLSGLEWSALGMSLLVGITALAMSLVPGIAVGCFFARRRFRGKFLLESIVFLPLVLPPVVTGYLLLVLLGRRSWFGGFLHDAFGLQIVFTWFAMAIAGAVVGFPLLVRAVRLSVAAVEPDLEEASRTLGHGPWSTFVRVTLPLARPGILAGALLAFARALGEFGATVMVASNLPGTRTLALEIYRQASIPGGEPVVLRLALLSIVLSLLALLATEVVAGRNARAAL